MNKSILIGRLTKDPELKSSTSGVFVCKFTLAVNRRYKNSEGNYDADFISCVAWRGAAELICKHTKKGSLIGIVGALQTHSYEKDGQRIYATDVVVDEIKLLDFKKEDETSQIDADYPYLDCSAPGDDLPY